MASSQDPESREMEGEVRIVVCGGDAESRAALGRQLLQAAGRAIQVATADGIAELAMAASGANIAVILPQCGDSPMPSKLAAHVAAMMGVMQVLALASDDPGPALASIGNVARGGPRGASAAEVAAADQFEVRLLWWGDQALLPGRPYRLALGGREVDATVTAIKHREDFETGAHLAAKSLARDEIALATLSTARPIAFRAFREDRRQGAFVLRDKLSSEPLGAGTIEFALRRAANIHWQAVDLDKAARAALMRQKPICIWFTGLSGSGKSTIANLLEKRLHAKGRHTYLLDGDNVRHGLNRDLGFTEADRVENIRRVAEVARLMVDAGLVVLVSFISPYRAERRMARALFEDGEFLEVYVDAPLEECERRDPKGLYAKARRGEIRNFTGIDSGYEPPEAAEVRVPTRELSPEACVQRILNFLDA